MRHWQADRKTLAMVHHRPRHQENPELKWFCFFSSRAATAAASTSAVSNKIEIVELVVHHQEHLSLEVHCFLVPYF